MKKSKQIVKQDADAESSSDPAENDEMYEKLLKEMQKVKKKQGNNGVDEGHDDDENGEDLDDEEGEFEIDDLDGEMGEDEIDEEESEEDIIDYNHKQGQGPVEEDSSEDSEDNIISKTIKQKQQDRKSSLKELEEQQGKSNKKRQKTAADDKDNAGQIKDASQINEFDFQKDMDQVQKRLGKQSEVPLQERGKTMDIDFEYVSPSEPYFHFVKTMLVNYLDGQEQESFNMSAMADYILERASIGSVIASSLGFEDPERNPEYADLPDDEFEKIALKFNAKREVYGFISIASLSFSQKKLPWLKQVNNYILSKIEKHLQQSPTKQEQFRKILEVKNIGLLISERLVNMPPDIAPRLHLGLPEDIVFTKQQDDIDDPKEFDYDYLVVLTKFTVPNELVAKGEHNKVNRLYYHWEDQMFEQNAEFSFNYLSTFKEVTEDGQKSFVQGACQQAGGGKETQFRLIYMIKWQDYKKVAQTLDSYVKSN